MKKPPSADDRTTGNVVPQSISWPEPAPAPAAAAGNVAPTRRFDVPFELIAQTRPDIDLGDFMDAPPTAVDAVVGLKPPPAAVAAGDQLGDFVGLASTAIDDARRATTDVTGDDLVDIDIDVAADGPFAPEPEFSGGGDDNTGRFRLDDFMSAAGDTLMLGDPTQIVETAVIRAVNVDGAADDEGGALQHETRICIGADIEAMLGPHTVLLQRPDRPEAKLSPFELFVFSQLDGTVTVSGLTDATGISAGDIRIALALLADKGQLELLAATAAVPPTTTTTTTPTTTTTTPTTPAAAAVVDGPIAMDITNLLLEDPPPPPVIEAASFTMKPAVEAASFTMKAAPDATTSPSTATATATASPFEVEAPTEAPAAISRSFGRITIMKRVAGTSTDSLSAFEQHVVSLVDGVRSVVGIIEASGLSESDVKVALELLARRGVVESTTPAKQRPASQPPAATAGGAPASTPPTPSPPSAPSTPASSLPRTSTSGMTGWRSDPTEGVMGLPGQALVGGRPAPKPTSSLPAQAYAPPAAFVTAPPTPATKSTTATTATTKAAFAPAASIPVPAAMAPGTQPQAAFSQPPSTGWASASSSQVDRLLRTAAQAEQQGELDKAVVALRRAAELSPLSPMIHNRLGVALTRQKDLPGAIQAFGKALELQPDDPTILSNYTRIAQMAENSGAAPKGSLWSRLRGK
jgi:hypothetical protein